MTVISVIAPVSSAGYVLQVRWVLMSFFDQPVPPAMPWQAPYPNEVVQPWT